MRLRILLAKVNPEAIPVPTRCTYAGCSGQKFHLRKARHKIAARYCLSGGASASLSVFEVQTDLSGLSAIWPVVRRPAPRVKGLAVMLHLLGLSYGATSLALEALGVYLCKSRIYDAVQEAAKLVPGLKRDQVFAGVHTPALGGDLTRVKCKGQWLPLGISVDPISGLALTIDQLSGEDSKTLQEWIEPIAMSVGASVLVTDDADGFKTVADEVGIEHQVCKAHVLRNTETLIERFQPLVARDADGSLKAIGVSPQQAEADLTRGARTGQESTTGAGHGTGSDASALCASLATARRRAPEFSLSPPALVSGSLESLASLDALSPVERTQRGNA